jgi:UDP-N-acetylmuramate--alanine ligase
VLNALAAIAIASELNVPDVAIIKALKEFKGVGRRFERYGEIQATPRNGNTAGTFTLIDDYGHHPVEVQAVIAAARGAFPNRRLVMAFQPHRYTRTRDCFEDFVKVLSRADVVLLTEVYSAGESPIVAADTRSLIRAIRVAGKVEPLFVETTDELPQAILDVAQADDVVIVMGAGSIGHVALKTKELQLRGLARA